MMNGVTLVAIAMGWATRWAMGRAAGQVMRHATMRATGGGRNSNPDSRMSIATENHKFLVIKLHSQWKKQMKNNGKKQMKNNGKNE
jgi:hypothetical protein